MISSGCCQPAHNDWQFARVIQNLLPASQVFNVIFIQEALRLLLGKGIQMNCSHHATQFVPTCSGLSASGNYNTDASRWLIFWQAQQPLLQFRACGLEVLKDEESRP